MRNRELFGYRFIAAFILSSALFALVLLFSYGISYWNYQQLSSQTNTLEISIAHLDTLLRGFQCETSILVDSSEAFDNAAATLNLLERRFGKHDPRVLEQKKLYSELEYRHLLIVERFNHGCHTNFLPLLFFYSNRDLAHEDASERMGFILTSFEREAGDRIMIYSFDVDLASPIVEKLTQEHEIERAPVVIINNSETLYVRSLSDLAPYLS